MESTQESKIEEHREGPVAKTIENQTAKIPSDVFLWGAGAAIVGSLGLQLMKKAKLANFVGQWVPTILILGLYNKIVKVAGSDRAEKDDEFDTASPSLH